MRLAGRCYLHKLFAFAILLSLSGCGLMTVSNHPGDAETVSYYSIWPNQPAEGLSQLVVVNPYRLTCCGAAASYRLDIQGQGIEYSNDSLRPVDDFFCVDLPPGAYRAEVHMGGEQRTSRQLALTANSVTFLAADVDLRRKRLDADLRPQSQKEALHYINRAMAHRLRQYNDWLARSGLSEAEQAHAQAQWMSRGPECERPSGPA